MERTIGDSLGQMTRGTLGIQQSTVEGRILAVNYVQRLLRVQANGHANLRRVKVASSVHLGDEQHKIVYPGDHCTLQKNKRTGVWQCIGVRRKVHCPPSQDVSGEVAVDIQYSDSSITGDYGLTLTPYDTFVPPVEIGGNISLPAQEPPTTITICGITYDFCCDTSPPEDGMTFVFDSSTPCIKWGFRRAPCPLYFRWQGAIGIGTIAPGVCVSGYYAYAVFGNASESFLATYDLSDLDLPVLTDLQSLGVYGDESFGFGIGTSLDSLWVSDQIAGTIKHFDISTRSAPSFVAEYSEPIANGWKIHRHYDTGTMTFTGNPYLVGFNFDDLAAPELIFNPLKVIDGYSGSVVGTLDYSAGVMGSTLGIVICDNVALVVTSTTLIATPDLWAVDISDVTTPTLLWTDTPTFIPQVYLGGNQAYVQTTNHTILYTQTDVDNTHIDLGLTTVLNERIPFGYFLDSTCLYKSGSGAFAHSYSVTDPENPRPGWVRNSPIPTPVSEPFPYGPNAWIDKESDILYIAQIGLGFDSNFYLSVFSNTNA